MMLIKYNFSYKYPTVFIRITSITDPDDTTIPETVTI